MYNTILLTLDGSPLSEQALPHAEAFARGLGSHLLILRAVSPVIMLSEFQYSGEAYQAMIDAEFSAAQQYLDSIVQDLRYRGVQAEGICLVGEPATAILDCAAERGAQLIVMATHGRSGLGRFVYGSVADRVLHSATIPVLLVRAKEHEAAAQPSATAAANG